jgi:hypothetical protein
MMRTSVRSWIKVLGFSGLAGATVLGGACSTSNESPSGSSSGAIDGGSTPTPDGSSSSSGSSSGDLVPGGDKLTLDERDVYDRGGDSVPSVQQLAQIADSLFNFDPTLDPGKTATENANAIGQEARTNLGTTCGTVTVTGTSVTVDYGAPPGCVLKNGITASGSVTAAVTAASPTLTVALTFSALVVNGQSLAGSASFATSNGSSFTVNATLTSGSTTFKVTNLSVTGTAGGTITIDGSASSGAGDGANQMTFAQVTWKLGDCYPNGGTLTIKRGLITALVTFSATTPTTGLVTVKVGKKTTTQALPTYGICTPKDAG